MADLATPSAAAMFDAATDKSKTAVNGKSEKLEKLEKPEKPSEETYKANLKKAEKEHADSMTKFVRQGESENHSIKANGIE